jgi:hypothetical protein|tara:strand:+ start:461 stop:712 length:252 start_codon:yes stop_codon:yes gene_type:complete
MKDRPLWLRTPEAAAWLGCSSQYLKKNRDLNDGPLEEGIHYVFGASLNSPIRWEVHSIKETFHYRGKLLRLGEQHRQELQGSK